MILKQIRQQINDKIKQQDKLKTAEQKQQEFNAKFALALADQDRRLLELSGGVDNG